MRYKITHEDGSCTFVNRKELVAYAQKLIQNNDSWKKYFRFSLASLNTKSAKEVIEINDEEVVKVNYDFAISTKLGHLIKPVYFCSSFAQAKSIINLIKKTSTLPAKLQEKIHLELYGSVQVVIARSYYDDEMNGHGYEKVNNYQGIEFNNITNTVRAI